MALFQSTLTYFPKGLTHFALLSKLPTLKTVMKEIDWNDDSDLLFSDFEDIYFLDLRDDELNILVSTNELLSNAMKAFVYLEFADSS